MDASDEPLEGGEVLEQRERAKAGGGDASLDLDLPHKWEVVGGDREVVVSYGDLLSRLRERCIDDALQPFVKGVPRPLTFKEAVRARVEDRDGLLWHHSLWTCTAIVQKAGTTKFKIVPMSARLLDLAEEFTKDFVPVDYETIEAEELDASEMICDEPLTYEQAISHKGWLAILEGDVDLLKRYADLVFVTDADGLTRVPKRQQMPVWIIEQPEVDQLRPLFLGRRAAYCDADCWTPILSKGMSFPLILKPEE